MKRKLALFLAVLLCLSLLGCGADPVGDGETTIPTTEMPTTAPETEPPAAVPETEPVLGAFENYEYRYEAGRDREWEEDVVYLAQVFLGETLIKGHPKLIRDFTTIMHQDNSITTQEFFDPALYDAFVAEIQALIQKIPALSDVQIQYELARIVALLQDLHSNLFSAAERVFPLTAEQVSTEGGLGLCVLIAPEEHPEMIFTMLTAINGVPVEEILERLSAYISHENEYAVLTMATSLMYDGCITRLEALQAIGVVGPEETTAEFSFRTEEEEDFSVELTAWDMEERMTGKRLGQHLLLTDTPMYRDYFEKNYWWELFPEDHMLYIRYNQVWEDAELQYTVLASQLENQMLSAPDTDKVVVDLRHNPGGEYIAGHNAVLDWLYQLEGKKIYVLIDESSFSSAVLFAANVREKAAGAMLVGTPAGQPPNFLAGVQSYTMPNSGITFSMSHSYWMCREDYEGDVLAPDILIYQTLEDYKQGLDTVLETIKSW